MRRRLVVLALVAIAAPAMTACSHTKSGPNGPPTLTSWQIQPTADPAGAATSSLLGVSCPSVTACTAVGYYTNRSNAEVTLVERWNGSRWTIQPTAPPDGALSSGLSGVSCPTTSVCVAVGGYTNSSGVGATLAERWNGKEWSVLAIPTPLGVTSSGLSAVSCPSTSSCVAVGGATVGKGIGATLAERWNGNAWTVLPTTSIPDATFSSLSGVSCPSPTSCVAVGAETESTGTSVTLAEGWSRSGWAIETTANPAGGTGSGLSGVSCPSATTCTAVGGYTDAAGTGVTLAENWDGSQWAISATPDPTGGNFSSLGTRGGVSCPSVPVCTAAGHYNRGSHVGLTLVERLQGAAWAIQPSPNVSGGTGGGLNGVSCASPTECMAVGGYTGRSGRGLTLAERK